MKQPGEFAVQYETRSHWAVITQMYGSVLPHVWQYCVFNVIMMLLDYFYFDNFFAEHSVVVTDKGHTMMIFFVAFFSISRANMALNRFNIARNNLAGMVASLRSLVGAFTTHTMEDQSLGAKEWRNKMSCYSCLLLRIAMAACDYEDVEIMPWDYPEVKGEIKEKLMETSQSKGVAARWGFAPRTSKEQAHRVPFVMAQQLRIALYENKNHLKDPIAAPFMLKFNSLIDGFVGAYNSQNKMFTTPMPFPLVQMARTIMFLWVFTLPFALASDKSTIVVHCIVVFVLTYGFMGLETISLQLDNPFGFDDNDFDNNGMAKTAYEDMIRSVYMVDGMEWALKIREMMKGDPEDDKFASETTALLV